MSIAAHAIKHAVERAGVDKDYVEDCYLGNCAHGASNIGRQAALLAGMPKSTAGVSVNRFCSSGLQTIAMAANSIRSDGADCIVAGGVESISVAGGGVPKEAVDPELLKAAPDIFMAMIDTADIVAERYKLSREYQDEYSLESQRRMAAAQQALQRGELLGPGVPADVPRRRQAGAVIGTPQVIAGEQVLVLVEEAALPRVWPGTGRASRPGSSVFSASKASSRPASGESCCTSSGSASGPSTKWAQSARCARYVALLKTTSPSRVAQPK